MLTLARRCLKPTQTTAFRTMTTSKTYEELTAEADQEQLEFMKEMVIQVDEQDNVVGPLSKKDGACACACFLVQWLVDVACMMH